MSTQVAAAAEAAPGAVLDLPALPTVPERPDRPAEPPAPVDVRSLSSTSPRRRSALISLATWAGAVGMYVVVTLTSWMISDRQGPTLDGVYRYWDHWDTGHYMRISQVGYTPDRPDTHAFFPLFPILLRFFDLICPGPLLVASLVLSNLACLGALFVLHRFATHEFDGRTADRMLLYLMAWPTAFFLSAGYNASLYLLLSAGALYCMRLGAWWPAGGLGALASATRLTGVLLAVAFAAEYVRQRGWLPRRADAAAILLVPVGLVAFSVFCWVTLGDPLAFSHAQDHWGRQFAPPWTGLLQAARTIAAFPLLRPVAMHNLFDVVSILVTAALLLACVIGPWRLRRDQVPLVLMAVISFLIVLIGPVGGDFPMQGAPRYTLELVPIFFLLAKFGAWRPFERLYLLPAVGLQAVFLLTFINNVWVA